MYHRYSRLDFTFILSKQPVVALIARDFTHKETIDPAQPLWKIKKQLF